MAGIKYKSIHTGVQIDNAVSAFVNTIGVPVSKEAHTSEYQALVKNALDEIVAGHFIIIGNNGLVADSGISQDGLEVTTNKVTELTEFATNEQYPSAKCIYDMIDEAFTEIDIDEE